MEINKAIKQIENSKHEFSKPTALAIETLIRHYFNVVEMMKEQEKK